MARPVIIQDSLIEAARMIYPEWSHLSDGTFLNRILEYALEQVLTQRAADVVATQAANIRIADQVAHLYEPWIPQTHNQKVDICG